MDLLLTTFNREVFRFQGGFTRVVRQNDWGRIFSMPTSDLPSVLLFLLYAGQGRLVRLIFSQVTCCRF